MISKTTTLGIFAGVLVGLQVDFEKLARGDKAEITRLAFAIVVGFLGKVAQDQTPSVLPGEDVKNPAKPKG